MTRTYNITDREYELFFSDLARNIRDSLEQVEGELKCAIGQGYFGDIEHEIMIGCLDSLRWNVDQAFTLRLILEHSQSSADRPRPISGGKALVKRVKEYAEQEDPAGLLRFAGFIKYHDDEGESS